MADETNREDGADVKSGNGSTSDDLFVFDGSTSNEKRRDETEADLTGLESVRAADDVTNPNIHMGIERGEAENTQGGTVGGVGAADGDAQGASNAGDTNSGLSGDAGNSDRAALEAAPVNSAKANGEAASQPSSQSPGVESLMDEPEMDRVAMDMKTAQMDGADVSNGAGSGSSAGDGSLFVEPELPPSAFNVAPDGIELSNTSFDENAAGAVVGVLSTNDAGDTGEHTYEVSDARFEVVEGVLKLRPGLSLDHETEASVDLTVTVTDEAGLSYTQEFSLTVGDVNEGPSDIALSNASVDENAAGAVVGTLSTTDVDAGDSHSYAVDDARFEVVGGELKLKDGVSLDHEAESSVAVEVTTTDASGATYSETFSIAVGDVNEGPSDIALSNASVDENAAGAVVGTLSTTDVDAGDNHSYAVDDARFEVVGGELKLKDGVSLDHEAESSVAVEVTTTDASGATYSETFSIAVGDVNEGPSDIALSNASVDENAAGAVVGTLSTTDVDAGDSHSYAVDDARFEVVGGELKLKDGVSLDHEAESSVAVEVTTTDASGATYTETFSIAVGDVNEGPSDIALSNASVDENAAGAVVGTLSTTDVDAGDSHSYAVDDARFEVVGGELKLKDGVSLDHEAESSVDVEVTTTDASGATYSESFSIAVGDVNEGPSDIALSNASVDENAAGAVVGTLSTSDVDAGDTHSYAVDDARFEVVGGQLKLKDGQSLNHEVEASVDVEVTTTDASGATFSETFSIAVGDVNEAPTDISLSTNSFIEADFVASDGYTSRQSIADRGLETDSNVITVSFETSSDVNSPQTIFETGGRGTGLNVVIQDGEIKVYAGRGNDLELSAPIEGDTSYGFVLEVDKGNDTLKLLLSDSLSPEEMSEQNSLVDSQEGWNDNDWDGGNNLGVGIQSGSSQGNVGGDFQGTIDAPGVRVFANASLETVGSSDFNENEAGAVVGTLSTTDVDAGDTHSYAVDDARFEVVGGQLKLKDGHSLNHEAEASVDVEVTTTDASGATYSETFSIAVGDVNEGPSDIALSNTSVDENAAGAVVGTLSTTDVDAGDTHSYAVDDARFEVVGGELKLKDGQSLNHEAESSVDVEVTTTDASGATYSETFSIAVGDVNEGPSDIALSNASVDENAAGAVVGTLSTTDVDAGDTHSYAVDDARFEVVGGELKLKDGETLNHEAESSVDVEVTTTDASGATYSETFSIAVGDVNEGPSDIALSNASVDENAAGAVVGTLSTTDVDAGDSHSYAVDDARFEVVGGELKLKDGVSLDHEAESSVDVEVTTTDASGVTYSETFSIAVGDVNEGPSDIALSNASVDENAAGAVVGNLSTTDVDAGDTHSYSVDDARFEVVGGQLKLKDGQSLNHEAESSVDVEVTTTDASGATFSETFSIAVGDVNEGPSDIALSNTSVDENAAGAVVGNLSTTDVDAGDTHSYSVDDARFEVVGGQLKLKDGVSLDHEAEASVDVEVTTTDASGATYSETFSIAVGDVNEGPSDIALSNTSVDENAAGAVVGNLSTTDVDAGDTHSYSVDDARFEVVGGQLKLKDGVSLDHEAESSVDVEVTTTDASGATFSETFSIAVGDVNEGPSDIALSNTSVDENAAGAVVGNLSTTDVDAGDTHSYSVDDARFEVVGGQLKLKDGQSLNHEAESSVDVEVTTTDASGATFSETFSIAVGDVNEGPSDIALSNTSVDENAAGAVVGNLSTTDVDAGDTHSYSVDDARFEVVGGQLKLKDGQSLNHEAEASVDVEVTTTDASGATFSETFSIAVGDVNEGPSDIALSNASVDENAAGAVVGNLSTTDVDAGDTHSYAVDDARFEVVGGQLKLKDGQSLNHEAEASVDVEVTTTDASGATYSETFSIAVGDENEGPSDIALSNASVDENAAGAVVGNLSTTDVDAGDTHSYSVDDARFEVVGGQLKLKDGQSLNHEAEASVDVEVTTTDASGATFSETFSIAVGDVNEGPSDIALSNASVDENAAGAVVGNLSTTDVDAGDTHSYSVDDARFEVVAGQLKLKDGQSLNHEAEASVDVEVTTTDASGATFSETFSIAVGDVNEGPSDIALSNTSVDENAAGAVVGNLSTTDVDAGDTHSYSVDDARFEVVAGQLKLKDGQSLNHEAEASVDVEVTTTDASGATFSETFSIAVGDVNEGPSDIALSNASVDENAAGAVVGNLSTTDVDAGDTHSYSVDDARFEVVGGQLKLKDGVSLDHEAEASVDVEVTTTDASGATYSETFSIAVGDVNEGPSDIALSNASVDENAAGAVVGTLSTTDVDAGDSHSYAVDDARFEVVGGELKLKDGQSLNHEAESSVDVEVTTTDASGATYSETFSIAVGDVNEGPSDIALSNASVDENAAGAVVGTLSTTDVDAGDSHSYAVDDARFEVVGGELKLKDGVSLDHEAESSVAVEVTTTDASGATYSETFSIAVGDVNEGPSDIALSNATVDENEAGAVVGTLSTTDVDAGDSHSYAVDDARFEVVGGELKLKDGVSLDHEAEASVAVEVTTTDASGATYSETFSIAVGDVNEGPSDIALNTDFKASYFDVDNGLSSLDDINWDGEPTHQDTVSEINYENGAGSFWEGGSNDTFGAKVEGNISIEEGGEYTFYLGADDGAALFINGVEVIDHDGLHAFSTASTTIDLPAGEHSIEVRYFENGGHAGLKLELSGPDTGGSRDLVQASDVPSVDENTAGAVVGTLSTTDVDAGDSHSYAVDDARFEVVGGDLKLKDGVSLDHEAESSVAVEVTTTDASGATYSETFSIAVGDVNEGPSDIALSNASVDENAAGAVVGTLSTTDVDAGDSHSYAVDDARFEVVGGELKLKDGVSLDHEAEASVAVEVTTTDASGATYSETFSISVGDVNEGPSAGAVDLAATNEDTSVVITSAQLLANSSDVDGDAMSVSSLSVDDQYGSLADNGDGTWTFTPANDVSADNVPFSFTVTDGESSDSATATLDITAVADTPSLSIGAVSTTTTLIDSSFEGGPADFVSTADGWSTDSDAIEVWSESEDGHSASDGDKFVELNNDAKDHYDDADDIYQNVETVDGASYTLTFDLSPREGYDGSVNTIEVLWDGEVVDTISLDGSSNSDNVWTSYSYTMTGDGDTSKLQFREAGVDQDYGRGMRIDNIKLTETVDGVQGRAGTAIDLPDITASLGDTDGSETLSLAIGNIPEGAVLSDGSNTFTASGGNTTADVSGWNLNTLQITPTQETSGTLNLSVTATGTETSNGSTSVDAGQISVSVSPASDTVLTDISDPGDSMPAVSGATYTSDDDWDGSSGDNTVIYNGSNSDNKLDGHGGDDIIVDDNTKGELKGGDGNDTLYGRGGDDKLKGEDGNDSLFGGSGDDKLEGKDGDDILFGGAGDDELKGGKGEDVLFGGSGDDTMKGEDGSDLFIFETGNGDSDYIDGGSSSSWTDTIQLQANGGGYTDMDWTLNLDDGSIESTNNGSFDLSEDASGTITFADGSEISFDNIERIEW